MQDLTANNELLNINIGINASPVLSFEKPSSISTQAPNLVSAGGSSAFTVYLDAALQYDSFSRVVNAYMAGKRFNLSEGLLARHIIVKAVTVTGTIKGELLLKVEFTGSFNGTVFLNGVPVYNAASNTLEVRDLNYDLQTKNILLQSAKWLFSGKIEAELKKASRIDLSTYFTNAQEKLTTYLNQEWMKGIKGSGSVKELRLISTQALPQHLLIKTVCTGDLSIKISEIDLNFHR